MKKKRLFILIVIGTLLAVFVWHFTKPVPMPPPLASIETHQRIMANVRAVSEKLRAEASAGRMPELKSGFVPMGIPGNGYVEPPSETDEPPPALVIDPKFSNPTNWPDDARPEAKTFHQFAQVAHLYNFDPNVIYDKDEDFPRFRKAVGTATHEAQMDTRNNRIVALYSYRDRSASLKDFPGITDEWKTGTGKWDERQMIGQTFRILRELGYKETLAATSRGYRRFIPQPWRVTTPDGGFQIIYPFAKVILYDETGNRRVIAEYRMGLDAPVGLVDWFSLY